jgi:hypothetical protein
MLPLLQHHSVFLKNVSERKKKKRPFTSARARTAMHSFGWYGELHKDGENEKRTVVKIAPRNKNNAL